MPGALLTQAEADRLFGVEKRQVDSTIWKYPDAGERVTIPLVSIDQRESFHLDLRRARINLAKGTF